MRKHDQSVLRQCALTAKYLAIASLIAQSSLASASTLAYWRFEGDGQTVPTAGVTQVEDSNGHTVSTTGVGIRVKDVSGNGNDIWAWDHAWAGHTYQASVPAATIPQSGENNAFSVANAGSYPAMFTWSAKSSPLLDLEAVMPIEWTIEASIRPTSLSGHQTFVGRDGNGVASSDAAAAPLYFKTYNGVLTIQFTDVSGRIHKVEDSTGALVKDKWYNVAAVSDGSKLRLYRDSGAGYKLVGSKTLDSTDPRLANDTSGSTSGGDTQWGWTLGRGRYATANGLGDGHTDRFLGYIDEVRISDSALNPSAFLFSVPGGVMPSALVPGQINLAVLPDTQKYSRHDSRIFKAQTQWVTDNAANLGIAMTLHLGDVVDRHGQTYEWQNADAAMRIMEEAGLPYSILPGNHDVYNSGQWDDARTASYENYLKYFGPSRASRNITFGGRDAKGYSEYHVFESQGQHFLVLSLGWQSSSSTLSWAKDVMAKYRLPTIIASHRILDIKSDEVSPLWTDYGEYLWSNLIRDNDQIVMAIGGHHHGASRDVRNNASGHPVLVMVVDYQSLYQGGNGYMRLLQLDIANNRINSIDFSPSLMAKAKNGESLSYFDQIVLTSEQQSFSLEYDLAGRIAVITGDRPEYDAPGPEHKDGLNELRTAIADLPQAPVASYEPAIGEGDYTPVDETLAHWRFDGNYPGPVPSGLPLAVDISGNGNDLMRVDVGTPAEDALVFAEDASPASASPSSICFTGGGRSGQPGAYLATFAGMPLGLETFSQGYTFEAFFKLSPDFNADFNRWSGIITRVETGAETGRSGGDAEESAQTLGVSNINEMQWAGFPSNRTDLITAWSWAIERNVWHHVAAVNDGKTVKIFVDGVTDFRNPDVTNAFGIAASQNGAGWMIGASHYNHKPYVLNGCIGEIRISGRALDTSEFLFKRPGGL